MDSRLRGNAVWEGLPYVSAHSLNELTFKRARYHRDE
jgi:hypothetical protein